jgi:hypothetical protein
MVGVDLSDVEVPELEPPTAELPEPEPIAASEPEPAETPLAGLAEEIAPPPAIEAGSPSEAAGVAVPADMVAQIAQRVVSQISEKVVREIAWEVIPDLAEALIKKEIERLKAELQHT